MRLLIPRSSRNSADDKWCAPTNSKSPKVLPVGRRKGGRLSCRRAQDAPSLTNGCGLFQASVFDNLKSRIRTLINNAADREDIWSLSVVAARNPGSGHRQSYVIYCPPFAVS